MNAVTSEPFFVRRRTWSSHEVLHHNDFSRVQLSDLQREELKPAFWSFLCSEYDSVNLFTEIQKRKHQFSPDFLAFAQAWRTDEENHAAGFAAIYERFFDVPSEQIARDLPARPVDFERVEEFLADEFQLSLVLAYDEIVTTHAYHRDIPMYASFGPRAYVNWIRFVKRDEALHFNNLLRLIRRNHRHRLGEVRGVLERVLAVDVHGDYGGTFVLDHGGPGFNLSHDELSSICANTILKKLTNEARKKSP